MNKLEFIVTQSKYSSTSTPDADKVTAIVYTSEPPQTILFHHPDHSNLQKVSINSTLQTKPVKYTPSRPSPDAVGYDLRAQMTY